MEVYQFNPYETGQEQSQKEFDTMIASLKLLLNKPEGKVFIKFLLKHLGVSSVPPVGLDADLLRDWIGFSRAGESIFSLVSIAEPTITGILLAEIQKEKYNVN